MLFSATMPGPIVALARSFLTQPTADPGRVRHRAHDARQAHVDQFAYRAHAMDKVEVLARMLQARDRGLTLIFARTKRTAAKVADDLADRGFAAAAVHGDLGQGAREQALRAFRSGKVDVLVATDVAARGLDVEDITHVINYQAPEDEMTYVHRIGRTARAGDVRHRGHARRLGRRPAVEADLRQARPALPRAGRDLLDLAAPVPRTGHPRADAKGYAAARRAHPRRPRRRGARGPRRDRQAPPQAHGRLGWAVGDSTRSAGQRLNPPARRAYRNRRRTRRGGAAPAAIDGTATDRTADEAALHEAAVDEPGPTSAPANGGLPRPRRDQHASPAAAQAPPTGQRGQSAADGTATE